MVDQATEPGGKLKILQQADQRTQQAGHQPAPGDQGDRVTPLLLRLQDILLRQPGTDQGGRAHHQTAQHQQLPGHVQQNAQHRPGDQKRRQIAGHGSRMQCREQQ